MFEIKKKKKKTISVRTRVRLHVQTVDFRENVSYLIGIKVRDWVGGL